MNVLRTTPFIRRICSIDIVSLREITAIARRETMSIENGTSPYAIARRAFISIENGTQPYAIARKA